MVQVPPKQRQFIEQISDPTITDDSSKGYQVGNGWTNTVSEHLFFCKDATPGAAIWKRYYDSDEVDELVAGANFTFFYSKVADPIIALYYEMYPNETGNPESTIAVSITAPDTLITSFITQTTEPTFSVLAEGVYNSHNHAAKTTGTQGVYIYSKIFKRTTGGVETLITTSENSPPLTAIKLDYDLHSSVLTDEPLADSERLVEKWYGTPTGVGTAPTVTLYQEGSNASRLEGKTVGSNDLQQQQLYNIGKAGNDINSGRSDNDAIATLGQSITLINAQTPSSSNQFMADILGGGVYTESVTLPSYAHMRGLAAEIHGTTVLNDLSSLIINRTQDAVAGTNAIFRKISGGSHADVEVLGNLNILAIDGLECTSGTLNAKLGSVTNALSPLVGTGNTGDINVDISGFSESSTAQFSDHNSTGRVNIRANSITVPATTAFDYTGGSGYNTLLCNYVKSGAKAFDVATAGKILSVIVGEVDEVTASTITQLNLITSCYRRSGDTYDGYAKVSNALNGVLIEASQTGGEVHLKSADGNAVICEDYLTTGTNAANTPYKWADLDGTMPVAGNTSTYALPDSLTMARSKCTLIEVQCSNGEGVDANNAVTNSAFSYHITSGNLLSITIPGGQTNISARPFQCSIRYRV